MQVLLVTGGGGGVGDLDSTEILPAFPDLATSWSYSQSLPSPRSGLRGATLDNKVVITGTNIDTLSPFMLLQLITFHFAMQGGKLKIIMEPPVMIF